MDAKTIGIISIKGGVGKTSLTSALGAALVKDFNKKVLLVDANFSAPNLGLHLGIVHPEITLHHVLHDKANIEEAIYESKYGFDIIPGSLMYKDINPFKLSNKLKKIKKNYDVIVIDSSPNLNNEVLATMIASDELYVVTTPDHVTLTTTLKAVKAARDKKTPIVGIILNRVYGKNFELSLDEIEEVSGCDVLAVLPHEIRVMEALSKNTPISLYKRTESGKEVRKLAAAIIGEKYKTGAWGKIKKLLLKTPKQDINRHLLTEERSI